MHDILIYTKNAYFYYCYYAFPLSLVVASILYLYFEKGAQKKKSWSYFVIAMLFSICPLAIWLVIKLWMPMTEYWKVFYLLPVMVIVAYAMTLFWSKVAGKKKQWIVSALFVIIIGMAIHFNASGEQFAVINNPYKIEKQVIVLSEMLEECGLQKENLIVPERMKLQLCSYIDGARVAETISGEEEDLTEKLALLVEGYAKGIVLEAACHDETLMLENGFDLLVNNEDFYIYTYRE